MPASVTILRTLAVALVVTVGAPRRGQAQNSNSKPGPATKHPVVCAKGVRVFTDKSQIPTPYDTLTIPRPDAPVRVTNEQEMEAAELAMRARAGSVGATGVLITDEVSGEAGEQRIQRKVTGLYVPSDSARAQQACK